jgi:hypothetical protein
MNEKEETGSGSAELAGEPELAHGQAMARGICPDPDPYGYNHLSDRGHFTQSENPEGGYRGLSAYPLGFMRKDGG